MKKKQWEPGRRILGRTRRQLVYIARHSRSSYRKRDIEDCQSNAGPRLCSTQEDTVSDIKRYDCTNGGSQYCYGCYTMEETEYGNWVRHDDHERDLLQVQGEREWRPIETAPKDGTKIDLLYPYPRGRTINCYWMEKLGFGWVWRSPTWEGGELLPEDKWEIGSYPNMTPTHWMPVPKPRPRGETMTDSEFVIRVLEDARHAQSWDIGFLADLDRAIEIMTKFRARLQGSDVHETEAKV